MTQISKAKTEHIVSEVNILKQKYYLKWKHDLDMAVLSSLYDEYNSCNIIKENHGKTVEVLYGFSLKIKVFFICFKQGHYCSVS